MSKYASKNDAARLAVAEYNASMVSVFRRQGNWDTYSGGAPDTSDGNQVLGNTIGPDVRAEAVSFATTPPP